MRPAVRLRQLQELITTYKYPLPFSQHLQAYFKKHRQLGSKDRKQLRNISYKYFRLNNLLEGLSSRDKLLIAARIAGEFGQKDAVDLAESTGLVEHLQKVPEEIVNAGKKEKLFPYLSGINERFRNDAFYESLLQQPYVWIVVRKGKEQEVREEFQKNNIAFFEESSNTWRLQTEVKLDNLETNNKGYLRIQDLSSQQTVDYFEASDHELWWDACSGSGGKSLALLEKNPLVKLYNSDSRQSILMKLKARLARHGFSSERIFQADLAKEKPARLPQFDGIIADVPCTGSGTWARNPENLVHFDMRVIKEFQEKQLSILRNIYPHLKKNKPLIYITCSVFKAENEEVVNIFSRETQAEIHLEKYLEGYKTGAENMFICKLIKTS